MKNKPNFIEDLFKIIEIKAKSKDKKSYTRDLLKGGKNKIAQKVGEESFE